MTGVPADGAPDCADCATGLGALLAAEGGAGLIARYRPLAALADGSILGHLADLHGTVGAVPCGRTRLFQMARRFGLLRPLFRRYCDSAIGSFVTHGGQGVLLLPLGEAIQDLAAAAIELLGEALARHRLSPARLVLIHEGVRGLDGEPLAAALAAAREAHRRGLRLATGVLHCPRSEALLWQALTPAYGLVEPEVLGLFEPGALVASPYAELIRQYAAGGRQVLALGVDSAALLKAVAQLPVVGAAGDFVGRPVAVPGRTLSAAAYQSIAAGRELLSRSRPQGVHVLEKLLQRVAPVTPETPADAVFALFDRDPELRAVAVVRGAHPVGLISRYEMVDNMARPYRHELYGRKPCARFMDPEPLIVDLRLHLSDLAEVLVNAHPRHLVSGFVICDGGAYLGIGSVQDLVREVTAMQMEAARSANPLTQLPGNVAINQHIDDLLAAGQPFVIAYCDLDNFKPFNDVYGYARGDEVIRLTARILQEVCDSPRDFVGHVGGDDFVLVLQSPDWRARCERALVAFADQIRGFFAADDVERGGYVTENRQGVPEFHALTALSIGVAPMPPGAFRSHLEVAALAAEVKKRAKALVGNSLFVRDGA